MKQTEVLPNMRVFTDIAVPAKQSKIRLDVDWVKKSFVLVLIIARSFKFPWNYFSCKGHNYNMLHVYNYIGPTHYVPNAYRYIDQHITY